LHAKLVDGRIDHARKQAPHVVIGETLTEQMVSSMESTFKWCQERVRVAEAITSTEQQLEV
jgi:hypothetical protein